MNIMTDEEREALIIEYKHLHSENWNRGQAEWVVHSLLITGSLITTFTSGIQGPLPPIVSLVLIIWACIWHKLTTMVTKATYKKMKQIRKRLGMHESEELYQELRSQGWFHFKGISLYVLFVVLIVVYSYLIIQRF